MKTCNYFVFKIKTDDPNQVKLYIIISEQRCVPPSSIKTYAIIIITNKHKIVIEEKITYKKILYNITFFKLKSI